MNILTLVAAFALAMALSACMHEQAAMNTAPGNYESSTTSTDANGTIIKRQSSTNVSVDSKGKKKVVMKSKTTKDPKGILNQTTTSQTKEEIEQK